MSSKQLARIDSLVNHPNIRIMLDVIADAEGVQHGYNTLFGNTKIDSLDDHPGISKKFTQTDGKVNESSAAGRYQFLGSTWRGLAKNLGLEDFSELNQDRGAVELMREKGAIDDILKGDFNAAQAKLGGTWVSLPSGTAKQPRKTQAWFDAQVNHYQSDGASQPDWQGQIPKGIASPEQMAKQGQPMTPSQNLALAMEKHYGTERAAESAARSFEGYKPVDALYTGDEGEDMPWVQAMAGMAQGRQKQPSQTWNAEELSDTISQAKNIERASAVNAMMGRRNDLPSLKLPDGLKQAIEKLIAQD